jgi:ribosome-associated toxin RatA of RatAB toxin-antitoxin module
MGEVNLKATVPSRDWVEVFEALSRFAEYPEQTTSVKSCEVVDNGDGTVTSTWAVHFREGLLCWSEEDRLDPEHGTIEFRQLDGDLDEFTGGWAVEPLGDDVAVSFSATFDMGIPSLRSLIEPIAEQTLLENLAAILVGLLGESIHVVEASSEHGMTLEEEDTRMGVVG